MSTPDTCTDDSPRPIPIRLNPRGQFRTGAFTLGIMAVNPDPADAAARIGFRDLSTGELGQAVVRAGDRVRIGASGIAVIEVRTGDERCLVFSVLESVLEERTEAER